MEPLRISDVTIDHPQSQDLEPMLSYWRDTPREFWEQRGIQLRYPFGREEHRKYLQERVINSNSNSMCIVCYQKHRIGLHLLTHIDIESNSAIMHAHYWNENFRGVGLGPISYVKAMEWFFVQCGFSKLIFQTPKANRAAIRVKEKLGIPVLGEVMFDSPVLENPVPAWLSEVRATEVPGLYARLRGLYQE